MSSCSKMCGICDESYNDRDKKPLMLSCGHSYCKYCLAEVENKGSKCCPFCRADWNELSANLPVCYQLLPEEGPSEEGSTAGNGKRNARTSHSNDCLCLDHNFSKIFWCPDCKKEACKMCLVLEHKNCNFCLLEDAVRPKKMKFKTAFTKIRETITKKHENIMTFIEANNKKIEYIQKFSKTLKKFELELLSHQKELSAQEAQIVEDLQIITTKLEDDNEDLNDVEEQGLKTLLEEREALYRLEKPVQQEFVSKLQPLCHIATAFQELEDDPTEATFITKFCQSYKSCDTVDDDASAAGALLEFAGSAPLPDALTIISTTEKPLKCLKSFLPVIASRCGNKIRIRLLDTFWNKKFVSIPETDDQRLELFLASAHKSKLREVFGCLSQQTVNKLSGGSVDIVGLAINTAADIGIVNNVHTTLVLTKLHVSVSSDIDATSLSSLAICSSDRIYSNIQCFLHFPRMVDDRLQWMLKIIATLAPIVSAPERISALCLPECSISSGGVEMLLGLVHGCKLTTKVYMHNKLILDSPTRKRLTDRYQENGVTLEFDVNKIWT